MGNLIRGFKADLQSLVLRHRQQVGSGAVLAFVTDVGRLRARYANKLKGLRSQDVDVSELEATIETAALDAVNSAQASGKVEFV
jgi:hypothetical protein